MENGMKNPILPLLFAPKKSISLCPFMARYHMQTYTTSKSLLLLLQTPSARAREGMNNVPDIHASRPAPSPTLNNFKAAPLPVRTAMLNPANQDAGSCLTSGAADEKTICCALYRISRLPRLDQMRIGQIHVIGNTKARTYSGVLISEAIHNPPATAYHHQRWPLRSSLSSEIRMWMNTKWFADSVSGVK